MYRQPALIEEAEKMVITPLKTLIPQGNREKELLE